MSKRWWTKKKWKYQTKYTLRWMTRQKKRSSPKHTTIRGKKIRCPQNPKNKKKRWQPTSEKNIIYPEKRWPQKKDDQPNPKKIIILEATTIKKNRKKIFKERKQKNMNWKKNNSSIFNEQIKF